MIRGPSREPLPPVPRPPGPLSLVSWLQGSLGRTLAGRGVLRVLQLRQLARLWLRAAILSQVRDLPDDVTVLIGVRNRSDHRLPLALRSLREQRFPADHLRITVIDYGSAPASAEVVALVCAEFGAEYLHVPDVEVWSRGRCLNVGIRRATTKYVMTSDLDMLFSPTYVAEAVELLRVHPLSVVCSPMFDLPEDSQEELRRAAERRQPLDLAAWKASSAARRGWSWHPSITLALTICYQLIRGYDEFYDVWGSEDVDLFARLRMLGLERRVLTGDRAFYLHQWHPKHENTAGESLERKIRLNAEYSQRARSIVRNGEDWGAGGRRAGTPFP